MQLDGLGRQLSELQAGEPGRPENTDGPVFVDESGRRSKTYRRVGWVLAAICAVYAVTLVVAVLGGSSTAPWLPISGQEDRKPAEVEVQPAPTDRTGSVTDTPPETDSIPSGSAVASPGSVPQPGRVTASATVGPGAGASVSSSVAPPLDNGSATTSAPPPASAPVSPAASSSPVVESPPPVEESPPQPTETTTPPANELEGAP